VEYPLSATVSSEGTERRARPYHGDWRLAWPLVLVGLGALIGWATGVKRLYGYTALLMVGFACGYWFELAVPVVFMALGGVILLAGSVLLLQFVRRVPLADSSG
jgi:hypothetical protein